jgi:hypothetical protein
MVCDNLSLSAELLVNRKHTVNGSVRFKEAIALAAGRLDQFQRSEAARVESMNRLMLDDPAAESLILRTWEARIISHMQLPAVLKEWREPSHDDFGPRTRWSLFNAFTEVLKPSSVTNPQKFAGRTFNLNRLLVPPTEGPADIDATFRQIGVELADQEACQEAEDAEAVADRPDPDHAEVDAFWANYQAGY